MREELPPPFRRERSHGKDRRDEKAERRYEPEQADRGEHEVHRRFDDRTQDLRRDVVARRRQLDGLGSGRHQTSLLKRRMFRASTGITSRKRKTAIAEPVPKSFTLQHARWLVTIETDRTPEDAPALIDQPLEGITMHGENAAREIVITVGGSTPSVRAASSTSRGIAARPAAITTIENPAQIQM